MKIQHDEYVCHEWRDSKSTLPHKDPIQYADWVHYESTSTNPNITTISYRIIAELVCFAYQRSPFCFSLFSFTHWVSFLAFVFGQTKNQTRHTEKRCKHHTNTFCLFTDRNINFILPAWNAQRACWCQHTQLQWNIERQTERNGTKTHKQKKLCCINAHHDWYVSISMQYNKHCCDYMKSRYLGQCMYSSIANGIFGKLSYPSKMFSHVFSFSLDAFRFSFSQSICHSYIFHTLFQSPVLTFGVILSYIVEMQWMKLGIGTIFHIDCELATAAQPVSLDNTPVLCT